MNHPLREAWEEQLKKLFDEIDDYLEDRYGGKYVLHPSRPDRDETTNKAQDGLINVGATFTAGYGSELGRGYVVELDFVTLEHVAEEDEREAEKAVIKKIAEKLPKYFPQRELYVKKDNGVIKIYGDLRFDV